MTIGMQSQLVYSPDLQSVNKLYQLQKYKHFLTPPTYYVIILINRKSIELNGLKNVPIILFERFNILGVRLIKRI